MTSNTNWIAVGLAGLVLGSLSCHLAQPACQVIDLIDKGCESWVIKWVDSDGMVRSEAVPRAQLAGAAMRARAVRMEAARQGAADAGADR